MVIRCYRLQTVVCSLWFAFVGGAAIWFFQFAIFYSLAEIRCNSTVLNFTFLGLSGVHFIALLVGLIFMALVLYATFVSYRYRHLSSQVARDVEERRIFMARASIYMNWLYLLAIIATIVPVFLLPPCY